MSPRKSPRLSPAAVVVAALASLAALTTIAEERPTGFPAWTRGMLDIHQISTGRGNAAFLRLPDGTTLLVDAGDAGGDIPLATALPDASRGAGEWIARYIHQMAGEKAALDVAVATHFHADHIGAPLASAHLSERGYRVSGLAEVAEHVPIRRLIDRGYPEYGPPAPPAGPLIQNYKAFADDLSHRQGTVRERVRVGQSGQIRLEKDPAAFPDFEVRAIAANGEVWTGSGEETIRVFPAGSIPEEDRAPENACSIALRIRYGPFRYFTGGDLYGQPEPGAPEWWDVETPVARAIGRTDVAVVNHHGSIEPANPFFLRTLSPRVLIVPAWSPTHPSPDVLKRLLSRRIWKDPRDVFITHLREATKATIGPRAAQSASNAGHVVVRVEPAGRRYTVYVLEDTAETYSVKSVHGPYSAALSGN